MKRYYTKYSLSIIEGKDASIDYEKEITECSDYYAYESCFDQEIKWYTHEEDILKYSKKHPNTVFRLEGHGEETGAGDIWANILKTVKYSFQMLK